MTSQTECVIVVVRFDLVVHRLICDLKRITELVAGRAVGIMTGKAIQLLSRIRHVSGGKELLILLMMLFCRNTIGPYSGLVRNKWCQDVPRLVASVRCFIPCELVRAARDQRSSQASP